MVSDSSQPLSNHPEARTTDRIDELYLAVVNIGRQIADTHTLQGRRQPADLTAVAINSQRTDRIFRLDVNHQVVESVTRRPLPVGGLAG